MKTHKHLYEKICTFANLLEAATAARKGKNRKIPVATFNMDLEKNLLQIQEELLNKSYRPGAYRTFTIYDYKKQRQISAAPFRDRVVHHALCRVIEPLFDRRFISDSYACRREKGTHRAVERFCQFSRTKRFVLKCDIKKYFPSIDHDILKSMVARVVADSSVMWLVEQIIDCSNPQEPVDVYYSGDTLFTPFERKRGLPIGNLTSQFFANIYLDGFDHFLKQDLRIKWYIRYVDDFVIFSDDKAHLWEIEKNISEYLATLRLRLHDKKCFVAPVTEGINFLGYRIFPDHLLLRNENGFRFKKKIPLLMKLLQGSADEKKFAKQSVNGWLAHSSHADTGGLQRALLTNSPFIGMIR